MHFLQKLIGRKEGIVAGMHPHLHPLILQPGNYFQDARMTHVVAAIPAARGSSHPVDRRIQAALQRHLPDRSHFLEVRWLLSPGPRQQIPRGGKRAVMANQLPEIAYRGLGIAWEPGPVNIMAQLDAEPSLARLPSRKPIS